MSRSAPPAPDAPARPRPTGPFDPWRPLAWHLGAPVLAYVPLLGYRWDYLSHFLVGASIVLAAVAAGRTLRLATDGVALVVAAGVLVVGALSEAWWFGDLVYDWSDVGAGGLGAACAAAGSVGRRADAPGALALLVLSGALMAVGLATRVGLAGG